MVTLLPLFSCWCRHGFSHLNQAVPRSGVGLNELLEAALKIRKSFEKQMDHDQLYHGFGVFRVDFVVTIEATGKRQPLACLALAWQTHGNLNDHFQPIYFPCAHLYPFLHLCFLFQSSNRTLLTCLYTCVHITFRLFIDVFAKQFRMLGIP
jgi:hypothetical protein